MQADPARMTKKRRKRLFIAKKQSERKLLSVYSVPRLDAEQHLHDEPAEPLRQAGTQLSGRLRQQRFQSRPDFVVAWISRKKTLLPRISSPSHFRIQANS